MGIPRLTAIIAEQIDEESSNKFGSIIKNIKKVKKDEEPYIVFLVLDLRLNSIYFKLNKKFNNVDIYEYYYFGNNSGAAFQYYLTREGNSVKYLLLTVYSDLFNILKKNKMEEGELGQIIQALKKRDMIYISDKKGGGSLNLSKLSIISDEIKKVEIEKKGNIIVGGKRYNGDAFIRLFIEDANTTNKYVLVVPKVILENGKEIILPKHKDYLEVVKIENKLGKIEENKQGPRRICYICKKSKTDSNSNYSKKFDRTGINKIFTTTTKNTSQYLNNFNYDNNYSICGSCYQKLKAGEKLISEQFRSRIAGEDTFIIPETILTDFNYKYLNYLKKSIDLAFNSEDTHAWIMEVDSEALDSDIKQYCVNFIIYRTDGNCVNILQTIEDVSKLRLDKIIKTLEENQISIGDKEYRLSLGYIYRLIPVKVNKKGEQLDIGRVLSLYKAILSGERINHRIFYKYACEALEKGLKQLNKSKIDNYTNMDFKKYDDGYEDFFIKKIIFSYIILIKVCQQLKLLDKDVFYNKEKEDNMNNFKTVSEKVNTWINELELFLQKQSLGNSERALFYLGVMINRVAFAQVEKNHKTKPILKKIQMQGMTQKEITWLYNDVVEKLIQYEKMSMFNEALMNRFNYYYGLSRESWNLNDHANVFYIMAGYSYLVGSRTLDMKKEEEETQS